MQNNRMDFRTELYKRYYTKFKSNNIRYSDPDENYFLSCDKNFCKCFSSLIPNSSILELGCGSGRMLKYLKTRGFVNVIGIDVSKEQVKIALDNGCNAKVADVKKFLNSKVSEYDIIIAIDIIEHFQKNELIQLFSMINKALKTGGKLLIQTPNGKGIYPNRVIYGDLTHMTIFSDESLFQILKLFDFDNIEFWEPRPAGYNIKTIIRITLWKLIRIIANSVRMIESSKKEKIWTQNLICLCKKI
jgi:2-polyprenyl-3-methyl-5-hydroxy-6-metoxy-1,4-benzoquinol methylase